MLEALKNDVLRFLFAKIGFPEKLLQHGSVAGEWCVCEKRRDLPGWSVLSCLPWKFVCLTHSMGDRLDDSFDGGRAYDTLVGIRAVEPIRSSARVSREALRTPSATESPTGSQEMASMRARQGRVVVMTEGADE